MHRIGQKKINLYAALSATGKPIIIFGSVKKTSRKKSETHASVGLYTHAPVGLYEGFRSHSLLEQRIQRQLGMKKVIQEYMRTHTKDGRPKKRSR